MNDHAQNYSCVGSGKDVLAGSLPGLVDLGDAISVATSSTQVDLAPDPLTGSLGRMIILPTMILDVVLSRASSAFAVRDHGRALLIPITAGAIVGAGLGGLPFGIVPSTWLLSGLSIILLVSAVTVFQHTPERKHP